MRKLPFIQGKILSRFCTAFCASMLCLSPVWADDTEIFFGNFNSSDTAPNVLFVVDTSGSMGISVEGTGLTRMQNVQSALRTLLNNLNDVNAGMMRFSNPGGPVLYQVDYLDRDLDLTASGEALVTQAIVDFDDDAQEIDAPESPGIDGQLFNHGLHLEMSELQEGSTTITAQVIDGDDDAEERSWDNRCTDTSGDSLEMTHDETALQFQTVGLRFSGLNIPPTATVTSASISFVVAAVDSGGLAEITISGEARDSGAFINAGTSCDAGDEDNITGRADTTAVVEWDLDQTVAAGQFVETPDMAAVIQEIIRDAAWVGDGSTEEDDMVFMFKLRAGSSATGRYAFSSWERSTTEAPTLRIEYTDSATPQAVPAHTGLRFQSINVPRGATITSAKIDFKPAQASTGTAALEIWGENADDAEGFDDAVRHNISLRTTTSASVPWSGIPAWTFANEVQSTPDLKNLVQEIVDRPGWCGGNAMGFVLSGSGLRSAHARDADNGLQPVLTIKYDPDSIVAGSSCSQASISKGITSSLDDIEDDGNISSGAPVLDVQSGKDIGLRFSGINIPKDSAIASAYILLSAASDDDDNVTLDISAEQSDDAQAFTTDSNTLSSRDWSSSVAWSITNDWTTAGIYQSVDITGLLQGVVNRSGWQAGNAMALRLEHSSGDRREVVSWNGNPVAAPRLVVNFEDDGSYASEVRLVRDELLEVVDSLNTSGNTPIQDTLYEAALYYTGAEVDYGAYRGGPNDDGPHAYTRVSVEESMKDGTYTINRPNGCTTDDLGASACAGETISGVGGDNAIYDSPINDWCQANNHIILLTDGTANAPHSDIKIEEFIGDDYSCDTEGLNTGEFCVTDLVRYLHENDQSPLMETQTITTHTIGFNFSSQWLADVAAAGGGQYRQASQAADLVDEIAKILAVVLDTDSTFVAPVAAVNQFNPLNHRREVYFSVFRPDEAPRWPGNLKRYRLRSSDNSLVDYTAEEEENSLLAINPETGFFNDLARSAWTPNAQAPDGKEVELGGAGAMMPAYDARKVYTHYSGSTFSTLSNAVNVVSTANTNLTKAMFGVASMTDVEFDEHIEWILGRDTEDEDGDGVTTENRYLIADPLHSKPVVISYGGTDASPDLTIFMGTNAGSLHAINATTGVEQFSFIPEEFLPLQKTLRGNESTETHPYGIDGSITPWIRDVDGDGTIEPGGGDFVRLYFGMRRGGNTYFALDVSDRDNPEILWQIQGGAGDYAELGQTWSQPVLGRIKIGSGVRDVLFFSGGYDVNQDSATTRQTDSIGRAIFIADAVTGELIWSGGNGAGFTEDFDDMLYSIPSDLSVAVVQDGDEFDDMIFVGDMGGQVWRFDINNGEELENLVTGGVIADLGVAGGANTEANNRRFYHAPDIALIDNPEGNPPQMMTVAIGSGFHAHPLSTGTQDRMYMLEQPDIFVAPSVYSKLTLADLYNANDNEVGEGVEGAAAVLAAKQGWYFDMPNTGEKVLSTPLTFRNTISFTSYQPSPDAPISRCTPAAGISRFYQVGVRDASSINQWDDIDGLTEDDRSIDLHSASIIDEPVIVCTGTGCDMFAGAEQPDIDTSGTSRIVKTFWRKDN